MTARALSKADILVCLACFGAAFGASVLAPMRAQGRDTLAGRLGAAALACEHTFNLGRIEWLDAQARRGNIPYYVNISADERSLVSAFGPASSVIGAPAFAMVRPRTLVTDAELMRRARAASAVVVGLGTAIGYLALRAGAPLLWSAFGALTMAFAFSGCATLGQGLWQQTAELLPIMFTVALLAWGTRSRGWLLSAPAFMGTALLVRPADAPLILGLFAAWVVIAQRARTSRGQLLLAAAFACSAASPLVLWNLVYADTVFPLGQMRSNLEQARGSAMFSVAPAHLSTALMGLLISPARGLVWFAPAALFTPPLILRAEAFGRWIALGFAAELLFVSSFFKWWGGQCFGPRLMATAVWVGIWFAFRLANERGSATRRVLGAAAGVTVVVGVLGLFLYDPRQWEIRRNPDRTPSALWDVADSPLAALSRATSGVLQDAPPGPFEYCADFVLGRAERNGAGE